MKTSLFIRIRSHNVLIEASTVRTKVTAHPWLVPAPFWRLLANNTCLGPVPGPVLASAGGAESNCCCRHAVSGHWDNVNTGDRHTSTSPHWQVVWLMHSCSHASSSYTPEQQHYIRGAFLTFTPRPIISCNNFSV